MSAPLELARFAYHYVDPRLDGPVYSPQEQDVPALPPDILNFLLEMVSEIWDAPDAGSTRSARFAAPEEGQEAATRELIEAIRAGESGFYPASMQLAERLHAQSPANASPGLLGVLQLVRPEDGAEFIALLKIRHKDEAFVQVLTGDRPQLEVTRLENVLMRGIQKGAIHPHPDRPEYDLKVIDTQAREDPAAYFTEKFLGCASKQSDEHQIKKLVPFLERYADAKDLPIAIEKVSGVLQELRQQPANISAPVLAEVVAKQELFGDSFEESDFEVFLDDNDLGDLDIPAEEFHNNRRASRRLVYRFLDPEYEGLEISGPPEAFSHVLSSDGRLVTFTIQVTPDGFRFRYQ